MKVILVTTDLTETDIDIKNASLYVRRSKLNRSEQMKPKPENKIGNKRYYRIKTGLGGIGDIKPTRSKQKDLSVSPIRSHR